MEIAVADKSRGKKLCSAGCGEDALRGFAGSAKTNGERPTRGFVTLMLVTLCLLLIVFPFAAWAATVTLAWSASTGPDVAGYKVYYGTASHAYDWYQKIGNVTTYTVPNLSSGVPTYCFAVKAYNTSNQESDYSNEVCTSTCTYSISPTSAQFSASGGTGTVSVTTQTGCPWTASSGASWLTITSGGSGLGSGTITYSVAANTATTSRTAVSTFGKQAFTVTQAAGTGATQSSLVVDDGQAGTTAVGTWNVSSCDYPYGKQSLFSKDTTATYNFKSSRSGQQAVYLWWTQHENRVASVPVRIYNGSTLIKTVYVNQTQNGGKWNYLGTFTFSGQAWIQIVSTSSTKSTCADAVKFVPSS